jgi:hypothetical protein
MFTSWLNGMFFTNCVSDDNQVRPMDIQLQPIDSAHTVWICIVSFESSGQFL